MSAMGDPVALKKSRENYFDEHDTFLHDVNLSVRMEKDRHRSGNPNAKSCIVHPELERTQVSTTDTNDDEEQVHYAQMLL